VTGAEHDVEVDGRSWPDHLTGTLVIVTVGAVLNATVLTVLVDGAQVFSEVGRGVAGIHDHVAGPGHAGT
jgi:hypothetical protein